MSQLDYKTKQRIFLEAAVAWDKDECLIWPFGRSNDGYAIASVAKSKTRKASRIVCNLVWGNPDDVQAQAAHICGNGSKGCVSGNHIEWKSPKQNCADRKKHGTEKVPGLRGENQPMAKLKENNIRDIRTSSERAVVLAARYKITRQYVYKIKRKEIWKHV